MTPINPTDKLAQKNREAFEAGGVDRLEKQRAQGKLTARDRIELLCDEGSFVEIDRFVTHRSDGVKKVLGDGVITGFGLVDGRKIYVFSQDFTVYGGSLSGGHASKICKIMDLALKAGCP